MTDMTTVLEDAASAWKNSESFDVDREESLLEYPSSVELKGWKIGRVWVWSSSIPQGIVCSRPVNSGGRVKYGSGVYRFG